MPRKKNSLSDEEIVTVYLRDQQPDGGTEAQDSEDSEDSQNTQDTDQHFQHNIWR